MGPLAALLVVLSQFAPPQRVAVTEGLKCDWGTVVSVNSTEQPPTMVVQSGAGPVTYQVSGDTPVLGADHQVHGTVAALRVGTKVRVYFTIGEGARVLEVDLE